VTTSLFVICGAIIAANALPDLTLRAPDSR